MSSSGPFHLASGDFLAVPNSLNLPFESQGRSWRLESCLQEMGDRKAWEPHRALLGIRSGSQGGLFKSSRSQILGACALRDGE